MVPPLRGFIRDAFLELVGWTDPEPNARIMVVTGNNASGKSLVRRMYQKSGKEHKMEVIHISIEGRSGSGGFGGMKSFVYGSEDDEATGLNTARTLVAGFKTFRGRTTSVLGVYDEPEIGMSEELQHGMVDFIVRNAADWPEQLQGLILMTHSRIIAEGVCRRCENTAFVNLGGLYPTIDSWLNREIIPISLEDALAGGDERWSAVQKLFNEKK